MIRIGRRVVVVLIGLGALALFQACGGGGGSSPTEPTHANVTGTWDIQGETNTGVPVDATATLSQNGQAVTGNWSSSTTGFGGDVTGTVTGQVFEFTIQQGGNCPGSANGTATVSQNNRSMSGSYSGSDCVGSGSVNFTATRR